MDSPLPMELHAALGPTRRHQRFRKARRRIGYRVGAVVSLPFSRGRHESAATRDGSRNNGSIPQDCNRSDLDFVASVDAGSDARITAQVVASLLEKAKVIHVRRTSGDSHQSEGRFYDEIARGLSRIIDPDRRAPAWGDMTREKWIEVTSRAPKSARDRRRPLHNDEAAASRPAHIVLMYCERAATRGGGNVFLDVAEVVRHLERTDPALLATLRQQPMRFVRKGSSRTARVLDSFETIPRANWDGGAVDMTQGRFTLDLATRFAGVLDHQSLTRSLRLVELAQGDALVWWDSLVLHGRAPADAGGANRYFRKTGISLSRFWGHQGSATP